MADEDTPPSKRVRLTKDNLKEMSKEELLDKCQEQEAYIEAIMSNKRAPGTAEELVSLRESEEKLKQQQQEATQRENMLVMRLSSKDQEMQDYIVQIQELKQAHNPSAAKLRSMMLDPAVNLMFERMKKEVESCKEKLEQAQNDLAAWKFTPDSQTGKRLMARCRMLLTENEQLGKVISSGRVAKLESEIALEKKFVEEMKLSQAEMDEFLVDMDEDVEGMQSTICLLQQQLKETKELVSRLQAENAKLCAQVASSHQPLPQQQQPQQQYGCAHATTTDDSSSVERTTEAAPSTPEGAAAAPRTTHTPPSVLAANNNSTETAVESMDVDMPADDDDRARTPTTPLSDHRADVTVETRAAPPAAHAGSNSQLREVHNGSRTADDHKSVAGHATNNRTEEEDDEMAACPTTNGQVAHESDLPRHGRHPDDRTEVSACRYDDNDDAEATSRRNSRLHDDGGGGLKGGAVFNKTDDSRLVARSPTADYETEGTDVSSDAWSPRSPPVSTRHKTTTTKQLHGDTAMTDDDDATPERQSLRTDAKSGVNSDVMLNGIVAAQTLTEEQDA